MAIRLQLDAAPLESNFCQNQSSVFDIVMKCKILTLSLIHI